MLMKESLPASEVTEFIPIPTKEANKKKNIITPIVMNLFYYFSYVPPSKFPLVIKFISDFMLKFRLLKTLL